MRNYRRAHSALSMAIPTIHFFIDSPKITVVAELKDKQMRLKSLKGSPGWEEHNRILGIFAIKFDDSEGV